MASEFQKKVHVLFTEDQYSMIGEHADSLGLPVSVFVRMVALERVKASALSAQAERMIDAVKNLQAKVEALDAGEKS